MTRKPFVLILSCAMLIMVAPVHAQKGCTLVSPTAGSPAFLIQYRGHYCLESDFVVDGVGIAIMAEDVVLDLQGHEIIGPADGANAGVWMTVGAGNVTVRNGTIRGFQVGLLSHRNGGRNRVENLTVLDSSQRGIIMDGENNIIRRNRVQGTRSTGGTSAGISVSGAKNSLVDNVILDTTTSDTGAAYGIEVYDATRTRILGTRIMNTEAGPSSLSTGILIRDSEITSIEQNAVINLFAEGAVAIAGENRGESYCAGNFIAGYSLAIENCVDGGGNTVR